MRSDIENKIINKFMDILSKHSNPVWAYDEIDYLIFNKHKDELYKLNEEDQWEVRTIMIALKKIYR